MFTFRLLRNEADAFKIMQELFQNKQNDMEHPVWSPAWQVNAAG